MTARHDFDTDFLRREYDQVKDKIQRRVDVTKDKPEKMGMLYDGLQKLLFYSFPFEEDHSAVVRSLGLCVQAVAGIMKMAANPNASVALELDGKEFEGNVPFSGHNVNASVWLEGYFAAVILDDSRSQDALIETPIEVLRSGNTKGDEYQYLYIAFIQGLHKGEPGQAPRLLSAMNAITPELSVNTLYEMALYVYGPQFDLWQAILEGNAAMFNEELPKALDNHRKFWGRDTGFNRGGAPMKNYPGGIISLPLTAIAGIALERDIPINHSSDYMPEFLLRKQF